ncbi:GNAT family N-acetyltransferase [Streptomyces sp. NPDC060194]|uniref:GNAT family N-acetyltransferase n=1 Tax=Streptomyces sp. NPDC060194 TaxID=3347069 RepID=UPI003667EB91
MIEYLAEGPRVAVRPFRLDDAAEFTARARESADFHRPWLFPPQKDEDFTTYARGLIADKGREGFLLCERESGEIAGFVNVNNIVHGGFRCGALGYGAFVHAAGRGLMSEGLRLVVGHAFSVLGLHRLEINVQPGNEPSIALARRCGFRYEGYSPDFLFVDGAWRDHERWALTHGMPLHASAA